MGILLPTHGLGTEIIQRLRGPNCQIILIAPLSKGTTPRFRST